LVTEFEVKFVGRQLSSDGLLGKCAKFFILLFSGLLTFAGLYGASAANAQGALKPVHAAEQSSFMLVLVAVSLLSAILMAGGLLVVMRANAKYSRAKLEQAAAASEADELARRYQTSFANAGIGLVNISVDGRYIMANDWFAAMLGYSPAEIHKFSVQDVTHPDDLESYNALFRKILAAEISSFQLEMRYIRKDSTVVWTQLHASSVIEGDGTIDHIVGVIEDITERRKEWGEMIKSRETAEAANRAKSEFLANMSHDLRTPLNSIIGFSDMIISRIYGSDGDKRYFEYAGLVNQSGHRLLNLVNDLLDLSRIEAGEYELEEEWVDVVKELAAAKLRCSPLISDDLGMTVDVGFSGNHPKLWADAQALSQIVDNLLSNAIKYAGKNADVSLTWGLDEAGCGVLSVRDTGVGIEHDKLANIMHPFVQAHITEPGNVEVARTADGVGLGLHITSLLAGHHDAEVSIDSEVGVGTTVKITFPPARLQS
jgi:PAS domain S-box-containing protein